MIAPFEYVSMLLALLLGYVVFEEVPTGDHAGRRRADRGRRPLHHLARAQARAGAGQGAQGDHAAGMSMIYKIFRAAEMAAFVAAGETAGAPVDRRGRLRAFLHRGPGRRDRGEALRRRGRAVAARPGPRRAGAGAALGAVARRRAVPASLSRRSTRADVVWARPLPLGPDGPPLPGRPRRERRRAAGAARAARARPRDRARAGAARAAGRARTAARAGRLAAAARRRLAGLDLPNPLGLAAGFDKNAVALGPLLRAGFGFVEVGAATPLPQPGNPRPRLFRLAEDRAAINRFGFNNDGVAAIAARLAAPRPPGRGRAEPRREQGERRPRGGLRRGAGARPGPFVDFATVNVSSPNTERLRDLQGRRGARRRCSRG